MTRRRVVAVAAPVVLFVLLAVVWQLTATALGPVVLPDLGSVAVALVTTAGLATAALVTFGSALAGLGLATVVALVLAALAVAVPIVRAAIMPVALIVSVTPIVAVAPAVAVVFGRLTFTTALPDVVLAALTSFFPLLVASIRGLTDVDPEAAAVFRVLSASRWETFVRLRVPSSARSVFTGLRLSATLAVIGAVVAELSGSNPSLGLLIGTAASRGANDVLWAAIAVSAAGTLVLVGAVALLERVAVRR